MRKIAMLMVMLVGLVFTISARTVRYQVKYQSEWGTTLTAFYETDPERATKEIIGSVVFMMLVTYGDYSQLLQIDEDSSAEDLAIVNKLDKQGFSYADAIDNKYTYYKDYDGVWYKLYH